MFQNYFTSGLFKRLNIWHYIMFFAGRHIRKESRDGFKGNIHGYSKGEYKRLYKKDMI